MEDRYNPADIEPKWQARWDNDQVFAVGDLTDDNRADKFYLLEMLPYPSGRIHMGHVRNYSIGDVVARHLRMRGKTVLHPMGWDAFGMPAENAALERGRHPREWTYENIAQMRAQLKKLGFSYDWSREIATCDPTYYKHEQAMFGRMLEQGLAYRKHALANWCEQCQTVLANEQVEDGQCWRCGTLVIQKDMPQWFLRVTKYAEELLAGIEGLRGQWPDDVLQMQINWLGKSIGAEVRFALETPADGHSFISVFTTRPDTLFGVTFMSIAAEHPLALKLAEGTGREKEVGEFVARIRAEHKVKHLADDDTKEGVFTGRYCTHPFTGEKVPIWIANFVLMDYGTGAVMAVPAHDQRDFQFARAYDLPIKVVIQPDGDALDPQAMTEAFTGEGFLLNSGEFNGTPNLDAKNGINARLAMQRSGGGTVSFRLRDWLVSRQRYWGAPIPVVHCQNKACGLDGVVPVPADQLPVVLPPDVQITGEGGSPLARHATFVNTTCPSCGKAAKRETDTFDTFVESSWYFNRYTTPRHEGGPVDPKAAGDWLPIDMYIGGKEHAVMHLLYARFWQKMMIDLGYLPSDTPREPFKRLLSQGMVCKEFYYRPDPNNPAHKLYAYPEDTEMKDGVRVLKADGQPVIVGSVLKMSKTKRNIVDPDDIVAKYGADTTRLFMLFAAPPEGQVDWSEAGVEGAYRFLQRVWRLVRDRREAIANVQSYTPGEQNELSEATKEVRRVIHRTIERVTRDLSPERCQPNTSIAAQMELVNALTAFVPETESDKQVCREGIETLLRLLSPFAPHLADELNEILGGKGALVSQGWPSVDASALEENSVELAVQINGKVRGRLTIDKSASQDVVLAAAKALPSVVPWLEGKQLKKEVYVPGKIVTLVVAG